MCEGRGVNKMVEWVSYDQNSSILEESRCVNYLKWVEKFAIILNLLLLPVQSSTGECTNATIKQSLVLETELLLLIITVEYIGKSYLAINQNKAKAHKKIEFTKPFLLNITS